MTRKDQRRIVREYCDELRDRLNSNVDKFPAYWDGFEIRALAAYVAERASGSESRPHRRTLAKMRRDMVWLSLSL